MVQSWTNAAAGELNQRREEALRILEFWKLLDLLKQDDWPKGQKIDNDRFQDVLIELDANETPADDQLSDILENRSNSKSARRGASLHSGFEVYFGKASRDHFAALVAKMLDYYHPPVEPTGKRIAAMYFMTDRQGLYTPGSLRISPLLWAAGLVARSDVRIAEDLTVSEYDHDMRKAEERSGLLRAIKENEGARSLSVDDVESAWEAVSRELGIDRLPGSALNGEGRPLAIRCRLFKDDESAATRDPFEDGSWMGLGLTFFASDLDLARSKLEKADHDALRGELSMLLSYATALHDDPTAPREDGRLDVLAGDQGEVERFYVDALRPAREPLGKWPSGRPSNLMQQVAINLVSGSGFEDPREFKFLPREIMSVNGPPGTGKTTLLKDVVAACVVEKARLLSELDDPDEAFVPKSFQDGPEKAHGYLRFAPQFYALKEEHDRVNDYGILVCSTNNDAVENVSKGLPKLGALLQALDEHDEGQRDIRGLFDPETTPGEIVWNEKKGPEKDVYFTVPSRAAKNASSSWGLISVALGKKDNIRDFAWSSMYRILKKAAYFNDKDRGLWLEEYRKRRVEFQEQLEKVESLRRIRNESERAYQDARGQAASLRREIDAAEEELRGLEAQLDKLSTRQAEDGGATSTCLPSFLLLFVRLWERAKLEKARRKGQRAIEKQKADIVDMEGRLEECRRTMREAARRFPGSGDGSFTLVNGKLLEALLGEDADRSRMAHESHPYYGSDFDRERERLFYFSLRLTESFILASKGCVHNLRNLYAIWMGKDIDGRKGHKPSSRDLDAAMTPLLRTLMIVVPVISTPFASVHRMFEHVKEPRAFGLLIVDEAGQAMPHEAVGALYRCRRSLVVGDPKQVEPVVTDDMGLLRRAYADKGLGAYNEEGLSVQRLADEQNPLGASLSGNPGDDWVGCPLLVHYRCDSPMFEVSNEVAYSGKMRQASFKLKSPGGENGWQRSQWLETLGSEKGKGDHYVKEQGELALKVVLRAIEEKKSFFVISPFRTVADGFKERVEKNPAAKDFAENNIGTVHKFQGKEADVVVLLLGCDVSSGARKAVEWVSPNIVNVAASRAKHSLYVIGDHKAWARNPSVAKMKGILDEWGQNHTVA